MHCIPGNFEDDADVCELFCRIELYCEAWSSIKSTLNDGYWNRGWCTARGPPTDPTIWPYAGPYHTSGRKSFGNC